MRQGLIGAVLDYSTIEVSNEMHHALLAGGPDRLTAAGKLGLPQVICPGAVEVLVFNEPETVPAKFSDRRLVRHSPQITDVRLNARRDGGSRPRDRPSACRRRSDTRCSSFRTAATTATRPPASRSTIRRPTRAFVAELRQGAARRTSASSSATSTSTIRPSRPKPRTTLIGLMQQRKSRRS